MRENSTAKRCLRAGVVKFTREADYQSAIQRTASPRYVARIAKRLGRKLQPALW